MTPLMLDALPVTLTAAAPIFCSRNRHLISSRIELGAAHARAIRTMAADAINSGETMLEDIERMAGDLAERLTAISLAMHDLKATDE